MAAPALPGPRDLGGVNFRPVEPIHPHALWCLDQYFDELQITFEGGVDRGLAADPDPADLRPPRGVFLVGYDPDDRLVGCGCLVRLDPHTAEIKRMWVSRDMRGRGIGKGLVGLLEAWATALGFRRVRLDTNRVLTNAIALYRSLGYEDIPAYSHHPYAHFWFEKRLAPDPSGPVAP